MRWLLATVLFIFVIFQNACSPQKKYIHTCPEISKDQTGAFFAPIDSDLPVTLKVDPDFSKEQQSAIQKAVQKWNSFYQKEHGKSFFYLKTDLEEQTLHISESISCEELEDKNYSQNSFWIKKTDSEKLWTSLGLTKRNPAITLRCYLDDILTKQIIMVNTKYLNSEQEVSVFLHELGHTLGLNHSCLEDEGISKENYISCKNLPKAHPYYKAVLYPYLVQLETKESLENNDEARTNCLYKEE
ncbi:MAG: hypothetical protein HY072_03205 [Deltaproteobacteria bacterium]|nr:hypothetical protein [Deltaproteobacteria bacterium]